MRNRLRHLASYAAGEGLRPFVIRSLAGTSVIHAAAMLATIVVGVQLARTLGVRNYGYYGIAMAVISLAGLPGEFGIPQLVMRETSAALARKDIGKFFGILRWADATTLKISVPVAVIVAAGALLAGSRGQQTIALAVLCGCPIIALVALAKIRSVALRALDHVIRGQLPLVVLRPVLLSLLLFGAQWMGQRPGAVGAMALNSLTAAVALMTAEIWIRSRLPPKQPSAAVGEPLSLIGSALPMAIAGAMATLQAQLAILILGLVASPSEVGLFRVASSTAIMLILPLTAVEMVASPLIAKLHAAGDHHPLRSLLKRSAQVQFAAVLILSLPLLFFTEPLLTVVFGTEYAGAANAVRILLAGQIVNSAFGLNIPVLNMTGFERRVTRAMTVALVISVVGVALLGGYFGASGAALASCGALLAWNLLTWRDGRRLLGLDTMI